MSRFATWVKELPDWAKSIAVLASAFMVGGASTLTMVGWIGLPTVVQENEQTNKVQELAIETLGFQHRSDSVRLEQVIRDNNDKIDRILCLLEVVAENQSPLRCR